jgi:hypothetical protein
MPTTREGGNEVQYALPEIDSLTCLYVFTIAMGNLTNYKKDSIRALQLDRRVPDVFRTSTVYLYWFSSHSPQQRFIPSRSLWFAFMSNQCVQADTGFLRRMQGIHDSIFRMSEQKLECFFRMSALE